VGGERKALNIDFGLLLDFMPQAITIQDTSFNIIYQNRAMQDIFGPRLGHKCFATYQRRSSVCDGCGLARAFQTCKPVLVQRSVPGPDGGTRYFENLCFPLLDGRGAPFAGVEMCRDISDRTAQEQEVSERKAYEEGLVVERPLCVEAEIELRHAQKLQAVGELAAGIAHEINTPAQFVGDSLHFLSDSFDDMQDLVAKYRRAIAVLPPSPHNDALRQEMANAEQGADLDYILENASSSFTRAIDGVARISSIVRAMKEFAHPGGREKDPVDLNRAIGATVTIARNEYKYVAEVKTEFAALPPVVCHIGDINQVILNLLVNAAHAIGDVVGQSGEKGLIVVSTTCNGPHVRIEVSDTGTGIPLEIRNRLYDPFFSTKEVGRGTGQGLAIARSIVVDKHHGTLAFETEIGKGTTFIICLPIDGRSPVQEGRQSGNFRELRPEAG